MDWAAAASLLAEREARPMVALDRRGRIQVANGAFCRLLGAYREELLGRRWTEACTPPEHASEVRRTLRDLLRGPPRTLRSEVLTRDGQRLALMLEVSPVGQPATTLLASVTRSDQASLPAASSPQELLYEISTALPSFGALKMLAYADKVPRPELMGQPCYRVLAHRETPCVQCPVLHSEGRPWPRTVVREARCAPDAFELVTASLRGPELASIQVRTIDPETLGELFQARIRRLADKSLLSERERDVLGYLALGRAPGDISRVLSISERTVKFHQTNLLKKLGADSRFDLMRLLL